MDPGTEIPGVKLQTVSTLGSNNVKIGLGGSRSEENEHT